MFLEVITTNAAGIDVSSRKSTAAAIRPFGEVVSLPLDVQHNSEDLAYIGIIRRDLQHRGVIIVIYF